MLLRSRVNWTKIHLIPYDAIDLSSIMNIIFIMIFLFTSPVSKELQNEVIYIHLYQLYDEKIRDNICLRHQWEEINFLSMVEENIPLPRVALVKITVPVLKRSCCLSFEKQILQSVLLCVERDVYWLKLVSTHRSTDSRSCKCQCFINKSN